MPEISPKSPKSVHVDRSKKLYSNQAGLDSKVRAGCQNDLADLEKEKKKTEATAVTEIFKTEEHQK